MTPANMTTVGPQTDNSNSRLAATNIRRADPIRLLLGQFSVWQCQFFYAYSIRILYARNLGDDDKIYKIYAFDRTSSSRIFKYIYIWLVLVKHTQCKTVKQYYVYGQSAGFYCHPMFIHWIKDHAHITLKLTMLIRKEKKKERVRERSCLAPGAALTQYILYPALVLLLQLLW